MLKHHTHTHFARRTSLLPWLIALCLFTATAVACSDDAEETDPGETTATSSGTGETTGGTTTGGTTGGGNTTGGTTTGGTTTGGGTTGTTTVDPDAGDVGDDTDTGIPDGGDDDTDVPDVPDDTGGPDDLVVECAQLPPAENGTCDIVAGDDAMLIQGTVLGHDNVFVGGEVLVSSDGEILCAGCDCQNEPAAANATVLTCGEAVISPGLINAHDHITFTQNDPGRWGDERYDHRHDWRRGIRGHTEINASGGASRDEVSWGELRQVLGGTVSLAGSGSASGFLRNLDRGSDQEGLFQGQVELDTFPLGDTSGTLRTNDCSYPDLPSADVLNEDAYSPHVSEGIDEEARNEFLCISSDERGGIDVTDSNGAFIHGVGLLAIDGSELAANGTSIVWSPRSNISLYGNTATVTMLDNQGVLLALGTDWTPSGSINMLRELQCADLLNTQYYNNHFTTRDLWLMATTNAAQAMAVDDATGSIRPGLTADIAIFNASGQDDPFRAVIEASVDDTALVLRGGEPLYGDSNILGALPSAQTGCESMGDVCGTSKHVCAQREVGKSFAELQAANTGSYELFFCDVPEGEPTCVPSRPEYSGALTDSDFDGDGIANDEDNCPEIFNPIRPLDDGAQANADGDALGDACDPCPLDADTTECSRPDPNDRDRDGIVNADDNCPNDPNEGQEDGDADGLGDICDPCPEDANPDGAGCPVSIYAIKQGDAEPGQAVSVSGVVTGVAGTRFFIQVPTADQDGDLGAQFSGLFVFISSSNPDELTIPAVGDDVVVDGTINDFFGQLQISDVRSVTIQASGVALPDPIVVDPADIATGGDLAAPYESVLVRTAGDVTALDPPAGPGDADPTNEFVLDETLRVNDLFFLYEPRPQIGDRVQVTGLLRFANQDSKVEPRSVEDITFLDQAPPTLDTLLPEAVFAEENTADSDTNPPLVLTLDRPAPEGGAMVSLSSDNAAVEVPATIMIPEGDDSISIRVTTLDAPAGAVTLTASLNDTTLTASITVLDADRQPVPAALTPEDATVSVDSTTTLTVTLDSPATAGGVSVALSSDATGTATVPAEVVVPEGSTSADFEVSGVAEGVAVIQATVGDTSVTSTVTVNTLPELGLIISEVFYDPREGDDGREWVEIYNGTTETIDLSGYSLGAGGNDYTYSTVQLQGTLAPGDCFVVGGTITDDANANPTYSQAINFEPDFQNSGSTADAIALFNVPAAQIQGSTTPIDAVIYGGSNGNGLIDESGAAGEVDAPDVISGQSIERTAEGWVAQEAPTPNDCTPLF